MLTLNSIRFVNLIDTNKLREWNKTGINYFKNSKVTISSSTLLELLDEIDKLTLELKEANLLLSVFDDDGK